MKTIYDKALLLEIIKIYRESLTTGSHLQVVNEAAKNDLIKMLRSNRELFSLLNRFISTSPNGHILNFLHFLAKNYQTFLASCYTEIVTNPKLMNHTWFGSWRGNSSILNKLTEKFGCSLSEFNSVSDKVKHMKRESVTSLGEFQEEMSLLAVTLGMSADKVTDCFVIIAIMSLLQADFRSANTFGSFFSLIINYWRSNGNTYL